MKKILNEWKKFVSEVEEEQPDMTYGNPAFEKRFVDAFSRSIQDRAFIKKIESTGYDLTKLEDKIIRQLQVGMSHTWLSKFDLAGAEFVIQEKIDRYLAGISEEDKKYLEKFFGTIFGELNSHKARRAEPEFNKRPVAFLGDYQMLDWWIADDGIDMFYVILKRSMEG
tara:strand:- start:1506 stop:2009 length:504 start_codon:yes stop_codon:yes gene_type:complete